MVKRGRDELESSILSVDNTLAPSKYKDELRANAKALVAEGKGLLACDEPPHVLPNRMKMCWSDAEECTEEWRRSYRELMFSTPGLSGYVSGIILHEETAGQHMSAKDGGARMPVPEMLKSVGIIPGIKVDRGFHKMLGSTVETHTQGLDGLGERCQKFYEIGCRFAKWRSPLHISAGTPTERAIRMECDGLARYAAVCQEHGLVPIVEPDVVMDGDHSIEVSAAVTKHVLTQTFASLDRHNVDIEGMIIKTNMVRPGAESGAEEDSELVADATIKVFGTCIPASLPGIVFLSGGMSEEFATAALAAINAHASRPKLPWPLTFSYGRALQHSARTTWLGQAANYKRAQAALLERSRINSEASRGRYIKSSADGVTNTSLHVAGGNKY